MKNRLKFIKIVFRDKQYRAHGLYKCICGKKKVILQSFVRANITKSCGCLSIERKTKHNYLKNGKIPTEYHSWVGLKDRCYRKLNNRYKDYGGRGIQVCNRWKNSFKNFISDMGRKPSSKYSIDRINNDGDYKPSNCRWATPRQQAVNRRPKNAGR